MPLFDDAGGKHGFTANNHTNEQNKRRGGGVVEEEKQKEKKAFPLFDNAEKAGHTSKTKHGGI